MINHIVLSRRGAARLIELDVALRALEVADCDEQRDALLAGFLLLKKLELDVCAVLARQWTVETLVCDGAFDDVGADWLSVAFDGETYWVR
ncbi:hypothetical protein [Paraburkholderia acidisoli]|uniref:Uncharacterized protein n=1 Tax=Paraburkholderia acidisoli TaxID=2571748 RepID=A0A7Z2JHV7_9BURK|nr:hypothetical protein [Paraburkholderia acidisoli]QGZ63774.1 hypothetical protein FAZ98_18615 [Paraburkholderia acidisoli]